MVIVLDITNKFQFLFLSLQLRYSIDLIQDLYDEIIWNCNNIDIQDNIISNLIKEYKFKSLY